jgi:hypothetical protein
MIEDARVSTLQVQFWQCPQCNARWGSLSIPPTLVENVASYVRAAIDDFMTQTRTHQVRIDQIETRSYILPQLFGDTHLAEAAPSTPPQLHLYRGLHVVQNDNLGEGVAMIFRTSGAPVVRDTSRDHVMALPTNEEMLMGSPARRTVAEAVAEALRADREENRAELLARPVSQNVIDSYRSSESEYVGIFPVRQTLPVLPADPQPFIPVQQMGTIEEEAWIQEQAPTPFAAVGQRWIQRKTGDLIEITRVGPTDDRSTTVVHFKRVSDGVESSNAMLLDDFMRECHPYTTRSSQPQDIPVVVVLKDEEWEHVDSGEVVRIDTVDSKRDLIIVMQKEGKRRSVPLFEFANARWRKIIRRTAYDRLLDLEDD